MMFRDKLSQDPLDRFSQSFHPNESVLGADDRSGPLFFDISRDVAMTTDFVKQWQTPHFRDSGIQKRNGISQAQCKKKVRR